jgi:hypothetical protein
MTRTELYQKIGIGVKTPNPEQDKTPFDGMTKNDLIDLAKKNGIEVKQPVNKPDVIALLAKFGITLSATAQTEPPPADGNQTGPSEQTPAQTEPPEQAA